MSKNDQCCHDFKITPHLDEEYNDAVNQGYSKIGKYCLCWCCNHRYWYEDVSECVMGYNSKDCLSYPFDKKWGQSHAFICPNCRDPQLSVEPMCKNCITKVQCVVNMKDEKNGWYVDEYMQFGTDVINYLKRQNYTLSDVQKSGIQIDINTYNELSKK